MDVWVDIHTPKQALFFWPVIEKLRRDGYEVLVTARHYEQLDWIFNIINIDVKIVGEFGGDTLYGKLMASTKRQLELLQFFSGSRPRIILSSGSIEACRISCGLGLRHVLVSDTPHSPVNKLCAPLSEFILTPCFIPHDEWLRYGVKKRVIKRYRSLDPVAWIRRIDTCGGALKEIELPENYVLVRTPESKASYILGRGLDEVVKLLNVLTKLDGHNIVILTRYREEAEIIRQKSPKDVIIIDKPVIAIPLIKKASLVLSGGGTIAQEAALLGKPTIMYYPGKLPAVHRFLVRRGLIKRLPPSMIDRAPHLAKRLLTERSKLKILRGSEKLMKTLEDPAEYVYRFVSSLLSQFS
jgi:predicted glycosyltransferase